MLIRTFYLTTEQAAELRQAAVRAGKGETEFIRELLAEGIAHEIARFPALKRTIRPTVTDSDFLWAWLPGHVVKKTAGLSADEDLEIRRISFAQGATAGNRFYFFVMDALKRRRLRKKS